MNEQSSVRAFLAASVLILAQILPGASAVLAQSSAADSETRLSVINASLSAPSNSLLTKYFDPQTGITVDQAYRIDDQTALTIICQLLREEGLFLGLSSGINIAGAVRFAKERGPGQTIVTILCDSGHKYQSKLFNSDWLAANHLNPALPLESIFG